MKTYEVVLSNIDWDLSDDDIDFSGLTMPDSLTYVIEERHLYLRENVTKEEFEDALVEEAMDMASDDSGFCINSCDISYQTL